jgi:hypothetical protein
MEKMLEELGFKEVQPYAYEKFTRKWLKQISDNYWLNVYWIKTEDKINFPSNPPPFSIEIFCKSKAEDEQIGAVCIHIYGFRDLKKAWSVAIDQMKGLEKGLDK